MHPIPPDRAALEAEWLRLTRSVLPGLAAARDWPVSADHCFQRVLLDDAFAGCWYDHVTGRPAYRHLPDDRLAHAVATACAVAAGEADLAAMNARSLAWRGKQPLGPGQRRGGSQLTGTTANAAVGRPDASSAGT